MTQAGEAFAARIDVVTAMIRGGAPFFPAMAAGLEDEDWLLVYAAVRRMADDIRAGDATAIGDARANVAERQS